MRGDAEVRSGSRGRADVLQLRPWRGGPETVQLVFDVEAMLDALCVAQATDRARRRGYRRVVTGAMSEEQAAPFLAEGFVVSERLHLLVRELHEAPAEPARTVHRSRRSERPRLLELDDLAFQGFWRFGQHGLTDALRATPSRRLRVGRVGNELQAYAITGQAGATGYLQRVAVHPRAQRSGWGRALVADALAWLWSLGTARAFVNTQLGNHPALALYESSGFTALPSGLCVLARDL
jgi:GNAT superfamily N-acetyltransferase